MIVIVWLLVGSCRVVTDAGVAQLQLLPVLVPIWTVEKLCLIQETQKCTVCRLKDELLMSFNTASNRLDTEAHTYNDSELEPEAIS